MSEALPRLPDRIRVTKETDKPSNTDIFDADTGDHVDGVVEIHVARNEITVEATISWPVAKGDYDLGAPHGVKTATRTYHVKRLELESW
jgi:hypothetical protein